MDTKDLIAEVQIVVFRDMTL